MRSHRLAFNVPKELRDHKNKFGAFELLEEDGTWALYWMIQFFVGDTIRIAGTTKEFTL